MEALMVDGLLEKSQSCPEQIDTAHDIPMICLNSEEPNLNTVALWSCWSRHSWGLDTYWQREGLSMACSGPVGCPTGLVGWISCWFLVFKWPCLATFTNNIIQESNVRFIYCTVYHYSWWWLGLPILQANEMVSSKPVTAKKRTWRTDQEYSGNTSEKDQLNSGGVGIVVFSDFCAILEIEKRENMKLHWKKSQMVGQCMSMPFLLELCQNAEEKERELQKWEGPEGNDQTLEELSEAGGQQLLESGGFFSSRVPKKGS